MTYILRTNLRRMPELLGKNPPLPIAFQVLLFMSFCAEMNLRDVARALAKKDRSLLSAAAERNAKLARIRTEIEDQVTTEIIKPMRDEQLAQRLHLCSKLAVFLEDTGAQTVELAALAKDLIDQVKSGSLRDIQDLMETSVYLVDAVTAALVYNRKEWIRAGIDEDRKARALYDKIVDRLKLQLTADKNSSAGTNSLLGFAAKTKTIIDQTRETAGSLSSLWESPVVRVNSQ